MPGTESRQSIHAMVSTSCYIFMLSALCLKLYAFQSVNLPASVAVISVVTDPANKALITSLAKSALRDGAIAPMPPSWIPMELKLANPQSAYVAIISDLFCKDICKIVHLHSSQCQR